MEQRWQLQVAKNKLSEVIAQAVQDGPQVITSRGHDKAVVLSFADYRKLTSPRGQLVEFFRNSPLVGIDLDFERSSEVSREVDL
ncbi:type II toxin-antitoxin system Phd/YefM family antitoxin [bacterium]|nr:type II toxin-antitoxin system Phd/YefM family antitoxin [bacterium]